MEHIFLHFNVMYSLFQLQAEGAEHVRHWGPGGADAQIHDRGLVCAEEPPSLQHQPRPPETLRRDGGGGPGAGLNTACGRRAQAFRGPHRRTTFGRRSCGRLEQKMAQSRRTAGYAMRSSVLRDGWT